MVSSVSVDFMVRRNKNIGNFFGWFFVSQACPPWQASACARSPQPDKKSIPRRAVFVKVFAAQSTEN
jgi:hypothetical protein